MLTESQYQLIINGREKLVIKLEKNPVIDYSQTVDENLEDCSPTKKRKVLIVFDDMIVDMKANKILSPIVTALLMRVRKLITYISKSLKILD